MGIRSLGNTLATFKYRFGSTKSAPTSELFNASGGNYIVSPGNGYKYHTFISPGTFTISSAKTIEVLMVAGGGGGGDGGGGTGGGGGAGGVRFYNNFPITSDDYSIDVGVGGDHAPQYNVAGTNGGDTTAFGKSATGGGFNGRPAVPPGDGGSGGGSSYGHPYGSGNVGGNDPDASPAVEGYDGGPLGGGGAGGAGSATAGGDGIQFPDFIGTSIGLPGLDPYNGYFGGGGGSGADGVPSKPGGLGGGGHGASRQAPHGIVSTQGVDGLGGGGGGTSTSGTAVSKPGGNGIVVIRYQV